MRVNQPTNRFIHRPFQGRGASLYVGIGATSDAIVYHKCRVMGGQWTKGPGGFTIAQGLSKHCFVAQTDENTPQFDYTFPPAWNGERVWIQVRTFWNDTELPVTHGAVAIDVDLGGELDTPINTTGTIIAADKRDGGVYRIRCRIQLAIDGLQPDTLLIRKTAGSGTLADVTTTLRSGVRYYELDTAALTNAGSYTFALIAQNGSAEQQLDTITFTADAAGPAAPTGLTLTPT